MSERLKGILSIPFVPFFEDLTIDYDGYRNEIKFLLDSGSNGVIIPEALSEFNQFTPDERNNLVAVTVREVGGKAPVIAGVSDSSAQMAKQYAYQAQQDGASAVIAMPPFIGPYPPDDMFRYYSTINSAVSIPVIIHNMLEPPGTIISPDFEKKLILELENVCYTLEEAQNPSQSISALLRMTSDLPSDAFCGVFGGRHAVQIIEEYDRGSIGSVTGGTFADVLAVLWTHLEKGDREKAYALYERILPVQTYIGKYPLAAKEFLRMRGIIKSSAMRVSKGFRFDTINGHEMSRLLEEVSDLLLDFK